MFKPLNTLAILIALVSVDQPKKSKELKRQNQINKVSFFWFDANTHEFLVYGESTFCDNTTNIPCSLGYITVNDPSNPIKPNRTPESIENGSKP